MELSNYPPISVNAVEEQFMLAFAFIADVQSGAPSKKAVDGEANIEKLFDKKHPTTAAVLEGWKLLYGPSVYTLAGGPARNTTIIFYSQARNQIVIGVAGTNFISNYDWFSEDVDVMNLVPWNNTIMAYGADNQGPATGGFVSAGTARALYHTWNHSIHHQSKDKDITPIKWLKNNIANYANDKLKVTVTGHSLGGAISPALALALHENREDWNGFKNNGEEIPVESYIFAGPSPGDEAFMDYVGKQITYHSYRNKNDVVPHAWVIDELKSLHSLFNPVLMQAERDNNGCIVYWVIQTLVAEATKAHDDGHTYVRWNQESEFTSTFTKISEKDVEKDQIQAEQLLKYMKPSRIDDLYTLTKAIREIEPIVTDPKNAVLLPFLTYFVEFMNTLGEQHTTAYQNFFFNYPEFETELKSIFYAKTDNAAAGLDFLYVVEELIKDITIYYTKYRKKPVPVPS